MTLQNNSIRILPLFILMLGGFDFLHSTLIAQKEITVECRIQTLIDQFLDKDNKKPFCYFAETLALLIQNNPSYFIQFFEPTRSRSTKIITSTLEGITRVLLEQKNNTIFYVVGPKLQNEFNKVVQHLDIEKIINTLFKNHADNPNIEKLVENMLTYRLALNRASAKAQNNTSRKRKRQR